MREKKTELRLIVAALFLVGSLHSASARAGAVVVLIPGAGSSGEKMWLDQLGDVIFPLVGGQRYFGGLIDDLEKRNVRNFVCPKTEDGDERSVFERAEECVSQILKDQGRCDALGPREVHLLGHSMGGLVARVVAQDTRVRDCIHSVTTVATPNRGTPMADFAIEHIQKDDRGFDIWGKLSKLTRFDPKRARYLRELRIDRKAELPENFLAQDTPDNPKVDYYSFSGSMKHVPFVFMEITRGLVSLELRRMKLIDSQFGDRNDGVVPEFSMVHGKYLGHIEAWHWASACHDPIRIFASCKRARKVIVPHLERLYFND